MGRGNVRYRRKIKWKSKRIYQRIKNILEKGNKSYNIFKEIKIRNNVNRRLKLWFFKEFKTRYIY